MYSSWEVSSAKNKMLLHIGHLHFIVGQTYKVLLGRMSICASVSHHCGCVDLQKKEKKKRKACHEVRHMVVACFALYVMLHSNPGVSNTQPCRFDRRL